MVRTHELMSATDEMRRRAEHLIGQAEGLLVRADPAMIERLPGW
jgi:hypothetical protein